MICYKNFRLGKRLNFEKHFNPHTYEEYEIERDLRKMHRGWGKHRIEDETCTTYCPRLNKVVQYQKGKPKYLDKNCKSKYNVNYKEIY